jgi:hypothetical protein
VYVRYYSHLHGDWVGIDVNHSLKLSDIEDPVLFVKAAPVDRYLNFEQPLQQFLARLNVLSAALANHDVHSLRLSLLQRPLSTDPYDFHHFFHNLARLPDVQLPLQQSPPPADNGHVDDQDNALTQRVKGKQRAQSLSVDSSTSGTESSAIVVPSKCSFSSSPDRSPSSPSHSNPSTSHSDSSSIIIPYKRHRHLSLSLSDRSCSSVSHSESTDSIVDEASTGNLLTHGHSKNNASEVENVHHWPVDFYVSEIMEGFERCSEAAATHRGVGKVFQRTFGIKFTSSTFYDNRRIWEHPPNLAHHQRLITQGRHKDATWVAFMAKAERPPHA